MEKMHLRSTSSVSDRRARSGPLPAHPAGSACAGRLSADVVLCSKVARLP